MGLLGMCLFSLPTGKTPCANDCAYNNAGIAGVSCTLVQHRHHVVVTWSLYMLTLHPLLARNLDNLKERSDFQPTFARPSRIKRWTMVDDLLQLTNSVFPVPRVSYMRPKDGCAARVER